MKNIEKILDIKKLSLDKNGIYINKDSYGEEVVVSKKAWERIYAYDLPEFILGRQRFDRDKLPDHINYLFSPYKIGHGFVYLEIGCGPSHIAEYLMKNSDCIFIGIDFNYKMLVTLKRYLEGKGYKKFALICSDINYMPVNGSSIDYIYGGGVIEHFPNTEHILRECHRVLKEGGRVYNTTPALTLYWFLQFYNTIPDLPILRVLFELVHKKILGSKLLLANYGYQLAFRKVTLVNLHTKIGFKNISCGAFAINASMEKLPKILLRKVYHTFSRCPLFAPMYYVTGQKLER